MLVDIHAHLEHKNYPDMDKVIERARKAGMVAIVTSGSDLEANKEALELSKKYDIVKACFGMYPLDILKLSEEEFEKELEFIRTNKKHTIALGEVGLDKNSIIDRDEEQEKNFVRMIKLAEELDKTIIVHTRKAEERCIEILEQSNLKKIVMHCFCGNKKLIKRIEKNGWTFSIPCSIEFSSHFQTLVKEVSISQLLTETDSPFLSPIKGERNEPSNVAYTITKIAEIKGLDKEEVKKLIFMNYQKLFS